MPSSEASLFFLGRACRKPKRSGARIFTPGCPQLGLERKNLSTIEGGSTRNGRLARDTRSRLRSEYLRLEPCGVRSPNIKRRCDQRCCSFTKWVLPRDSQSSNYFS